MPEAHSAGPRPWSRKRRVLVVVTAIVVVAVLVSLYLLATIPLATRSYSVSVTTSPFAASVGSDYLQHLPAVYLNDTGVALLQLPAGAQLSGSWSVVGGANLVAISIPYGSGYSNTANSSGSFQLSGGSPFSNPFPAAFWILSSNPITVTISGTYTAPIL